MKKLLSTQPIGIFDSGIGGLTVLNALTKKLPNENFIYFGDTAHFPYGDKSKKAIQSYSQKITEFLLQKNCKLILVACNSASAAAYDSLQQNWGEEVFLINVVDPLIQFLKDNHANQRIGLIGTRQTVHSKVYQQKIATLQNGIELIAHPTNLLAAAIEEFGNGDILDHLIQEYLSHPSLKDIQSLILACTHYPIIKTKIIQYYKNQVHIIDSSDIVARAVKTYLQEQDLLNTNNTHPTKQFYLSDYTEIFKNHARVFFNEPITLEHYPLWAIE